MKRREGATSSDDDDELPDYSQWSFERPSGKLDEEIGRVLNGEQASTEDEDDDLPDYSNWKSTTLESSNNNRKQTTYKELSPQIIDDDEEDNIVKKSFPIDEKSDEKEEELPQKLQQSLSKIKKTMNEEDEFSFIPKQKKKSGGDSTSKKNSLKDVKKNKFDFSDILFDLDSEEESSDEEPLSYDEWKQKQEMKLKNKSPLDMLESLKKMSDTISPIDKPLNPQMTDLEHKLMLEWMFPLCKFKQK